MQVQTSLNVDITRISNVHISALLEVTVTWSGTLVVLYVLRMLIWPWPDPTSRSLTFSISANCTFLRLSPPPFWRGAQNWWLVTTAWDLVYSHSEPDFWISPPFGTHMTSKFVKCWYHQKFHWVLSLRCLWLEACDCDCRYTPTSRACWQRWPSAPMWGFFINHVLSTLKTHIVLYKDSTMSCAKMAEPIEMQFGMVSQVGSRNLYNMRV